MADGKWLRVAALFACRMCGAKSGKGGESERQISLRRCVNFAQAGYRERHK
jgi:hypothetical protein